MNRSDAPYKLRRMTRPRFLAQIVGVSDADTITCVLDRWFKDDSTRRIRLKNLICPELDDPDPVLAGHAAAGKTWLEGELSHGTWCMVETFKQTRDRYEGVITLADGRDVAEMIVLAGYGDWA